MKILVLNGSPRPNGNTNGMIKAFRKGAASVGHQVDVIDVCRMKINGCLACEYCHTKGRGECVQKDGMQQIYALLSDSLSKSGLPGKNPGRPQSIEDTYRQKTAGKRDAIAVLHSIWPAF